MPKKLKIRFTNIIAHDRFPKKLNTEELHYLSGILGHITDMDQLKFLLYFVWRRIKEVRQQAIRKNPSKYRSGFYKPILKRLFNDPLDE